METKKKSDLEFLRQQYKELKEATRPFVRQEKRWWARTEKKIADIEARHTNQKRAIHRLLLAQQKNG